MDRPFINYGIKLISPDNLESLSMRKFWKAKVCPVLLLMITAFRE